MTLLVFKKRLKFALILIILILYGGFFYYLGNSSKIRNLLIKENASKSIAEDIVTPIESPIPQADSQSGNVIASFVKLCSNAIYSFEITYPKDWFSTYNDDSQKCQFFAPYSFVIPQETDGFMIPVKLDVIDIKDWESTVKFYENPNDFQNIVSVENMEINGDSVIKIKALTTGNDFTEKGLLKISFLILNSNTSIVISYQQEEKNEDVKYFESLLSEMVATLKFL